jgi:virginiamycin B lyase
MTTAGVITRYPLPYSGIYGPSGSAGPIVLGPDGNLWFAHYFANRIGKINPYTESITEFWIPSGFAFPGGITVGPDGNLWFTEYVGTNIGKIDPTTGTITEFPLPPRNTQYGAARITAGSDGNLWYTEPNENTIGRITPQGIVTEILL